jgi:hypothetical protein
MTKAEEKMEFSVDGLETNSHIKKKKKAGSIFTPHTI